MIRETREGLHNEPIAARTNLGWTIYGSEENWSSDNNIYKINRIQLEVAVESFWKTESFGTEFKATKEMSIQDKTLLEQMKATYSHRDGHMVVNMLWKEQGKNFPHSFKTAEKRYHSLRNRLLRKPELLKKYRAIIGDYMEKGYAM